MQLLSDIRDRLRASDWIHDCGWERGATLAEYVLLAGFIALVVMVGVSALGVAVEPLFRTVAPTI